MRRLFAAFYDILYGLWNCQLQMFWQQCHILREKNENLLQNNSILAQMGYNFLKKETFGILYVFFVVKGKATIN